MAHPDSLLSKITGGDVDRYMAIVAKPLDPDLFDAWMAWLQLLFPRDPRTPKELRAIRLSLENRGYTTRDFIKACREIEARCKRFPLLSDFIEWRNGGDAEA